MAGAEQPLKKRKLYEQLKEPSPPAPPSPQPLLPPPQPAPPPTPPQISQDEVALRRRNQEEIRNVYECYNRIKFCIAQKDTRLKPDLERAYIALVTASTGCSSVQRLTAEFIPKYASYCPTSFESAARVLINMHNWSLAVISRGEDADGVALDTAKACIFGLADICVSAAAAAQMSSVTQGICTTVFRDAVTFFISSFEGKNIFQIVDKEILKTDDVLDSFSQYQQKILALDDSVLLKLSKFRALSLLRIFFTCSKNSIATCFELFDSTAAEETHKEGYYFLRQLTDRFDETLSSSSKVECNGSIPSTSSMSTNCRGNDSTDDGSATRGKNTLKHAKAVPRNCLLGLVLNNDQSLKNWVISRYKKLSKSGFSEVVSVITSILDEVFDSFLDQVKAEEVKEESEDDLCSREYADQFSIPRVCSQGQTSEVSRSVTGSQLADCRSNINNFGCRSMVVDSNEQGDLAYNRSSRSGELLNQQIPSPRTRPMYLRSCSFDSGSCSSPTEKNLIPNMDHPLPALRTSSGVAVGSTPSPRPNLPLHQPSTNQVTWYCDGDPAALDIYPASKHLWLGSLDPGVSEGLLRHQFEKFGPLNNFSYFPLKGFALVEFRNIRDAVKARELMRRSSPWGNALNIKFLDAGYGTRGAINGVAVGSSCHVYIGNVQNQWVKDEIIHELRKVIYKGPVMVTDLSSEVALLMEFETPEEAAMAMNHLRQCRNSKNSSPRPLNVGPVNVTMRVEGSRLVSTSSVNNMVVPSHAQTMVEQQPNARTSQPGLHHVPVSAKPDNGFLEHTSPRMKPEHGAMTASGHHGFQSNWRPIVCQGMPEVGAAEADKMAVDPSHRGGSISDSGDPMWVYGKSERDLQSGVGGISRIPPPTQGPAMGPSMSIQGPPAAPQPVQTPPVAPPQPGQALPFAPPQVALGPPVGPPQPIHTHLVPPPPQPIHPPTVGPSQPVQTPPFIRPVYFTPTGWDAHALNHNMPPNPTSSSVMPSSIHHNAIAPPYLPASVTPIAQIQASSMPQFSHTFYMNNRPPMTSFPAPQPELTPPFTTQPVLQPPLPSSPPHPRYPEPPIAPPPPSSPPPPPPPPSESSNSENLRQCPQHQWQGTLNKSGVHYCKIYAQRVDSGICKYSSAVAEPTEWPATLDMTKRTDFQHVMSTFSNTPINKREMCWLLPTSQEDHKGFQDFVSYLQQRECAGVIKMPAVKSMWARLLFILPQSSETCSMLSLEPNPFPCLIGLVLPKEMNFEWV
nr:uncharacterized protein LOC109149712 isoform X1 [Ipomoea batatas]